MESGQSKASTEKSQQRLRLPRELIYELILCVQSTVPGARRALLTSSLIYCIISTSKKTQNWRLPVPIVAVDAQFIGRKLPGYHVWPIVPRHHRHINFFRDQLVPFLHNYFYVSSDSGLPMRMFGAVVALDYAIMPPGQSQFVSRQALKASIDMGVLGHCTAMRAFALPEVFPDGPRRVNAAFTNRKSGVTILLDYRTVYRFRWDKSYKRFYMARRSPRQLPSQIDFFPRMGFQWKDGHLILSNNKKFVSFDPFWNLVTFSSDKANEYFPNVDKRVVGVAKHGKDAFLMITEDGKLQVYDMHEHKVNLEFPISLRHLLACLSSNSTMTNP
ncbi:hypothetical protein GPALN_012927 [Globodera pallida]|nr:hypothetical protein GPALN_012927 [Globodera pallida]